MADVPVLSEAPLDPAALAGAVSARSRGAVVTFVGYVRDHHGGREVERLEYSAYAPMVEAECLRILAESEARWPIAATLGHRVGALEIGDAAVVVAVGGGHRGEAFEACRWIIDEVKRRVPIWKREFYTDGTVAWVDPTAVPAPSAAGPR